MKNRRRLLFRAGAILVLVAVAAVMMVIGRGHTVYFDNKTLKTEDGQEFAAFQRAEIYVNGERAARLSKKERGMASCVGQNFSCTAEITVNKGDEPVHYDISLSLPYSVDGIVVNLPAYIAGADASLWQSVFVPQPTAEEPEEEIPTDEFGVGDV